jgi:hypothetical protein
MKHPLECPKCGDFKYLEYSGIRFQNGQKNIEIQTPSIICKSCSDKSEIIPHEELSTFVKELFLTMDDDEFIELPLHEILPKLNKENVFAHYANLELEYDPRDYYLIPGIYREQDDGALTPVFFDKDILLYYNNHPSYSVKLHSFSSGNIYYKVEKLFSWGFGINRNSKIFMWLGDLADDFEDDDMKPHLKRFQKFIYG